MEDNCECDSTHYKAKTIHYFRKQLESKSDPTEKVKPRAQGCILVPRPLHLSEGFMHEMSTHKEVKLQQEQRNICPNLLTDVGYDAKKCV